VARLGTSGHGNAALRLRWYGLKAVTEQVRKRVETVTIRRVETETRAVTLRQKSEKKENARDAACARWRAQKRYGGISTRR